MTKTRDDAALATIKIRMHEPLRAEVERAAKKAGRSMNTEMVTRLSRSFIEEDAVGGPELRLIAYVMAAAFGSRGCTYAAANGRSAEPSHWMGDSASYREAMIAVIEALLAQYPGNAWPAKSGARHMLSLPFVAEVSRMTIMSSYMINRARFCFGHGIRPTRA